MWQYCTWCKTYYYKLGMHCPKCLIQFEQSAASLPEPAMQLYLTDYWRANGKESPDYLHTPTISEREVRKT